MLVQAGMPPAPRSGGVLLQLLLSKAQLEVKQACRQLFLPCLQLWQRHSWTSSRLATCPSQTTAPQLLRRVPGIQGFSIAAEHSCRDILNEPGPAL